MRRLHSLLITILALGLGLFGCSKKDAKGSGGSGGGGAKGGPTFVQKNTKESLAALVKKIRELQKSDKNEEAGALTRGLLPNKDRLAKSLRPGVPETQVKQMSEMHERFSKIPDGRLSQLLRVKPTQTEIQVHCATTEEIAANQPGSIVFKEFPGGAVTLAKNVLRPGLTFCEVELTEPGKPSGMKYHLFFWDGSAWAMLGPLWRAIR